MFFNVELCYNFSWNEFLTEGKQLIVCVEKMKKIILLLSLVIFAFSGCGKSATISVHEGDIDIPGVIETKKDSEFVHKLYSMKDTSTDDVSKIKSILKILPYLNEEKNDFVLEDKKIEISYTTDLRSKYRDLYDLEKRAKQIAVTLFPIVSDLNEVMVSVSDVYGEFAMHTYEKELVNSLPGGAYFTLENMEKALKNKSSFETYLMKILDMNPEENGFEAYYEKIFKKLSDNEIVNYETAKFTEKIYEGEDKFEGFDLKECAKKNKVDLHKYIGENLIFAVCEIVDFTDGKTSEHFYVFKSENILIYE